jgi:hypothetical protein
MKTATLKTGEAVNVLSAHAEFGRVKVMGTGSNDGEVWSVKEEDLINDQTSEPAILTAAKQDTEHFIFARIATN